MSNLNRPVLFLVLASVLWSTGGLLIKSIAWNALAIAGARSAIAAGVVYLLMPRPRFTFSAAQLGAAVCYAATVILFVLANKMTTAANAIFLQYTAPIYIALFGAWFLKEHPTGLDWALIALAQVGIGLFFLDRLTFQGVWGNVSALASGLAFAGLILLLRQQRMALRRIGFGGQPPDGAGLPAVRAQLQPGGRKLGRTGAAGRFSIGPFLCAVCHRHQAGSRIGSRLD